MAQATLGDVFQYLRRICAAQEARGLPDRELLTLFLGQREQAAFAALVHRHGPMVLRVCRRLLGDFHAAEDAFQATFVVLARRAASIRKKESVGTWLYGVARRVAAKARAQAATRRNRERRLTDMAQAEPLDDLTWQELHDVLDEEIGRLPEKYQAALVFCYFEGKTHAQAAKELGWPKNTLTSRLERGRELLRQQLVRRGITLSVAALATALSEEALAAPVGAMLAINTVKAAMSVAAGKAVAGGCLSAQALALAEEAMAGMMLVKAKLVVIVLVLGLAAGGAGLAGYVRLSENGPPAQAETAQKPAAKPQPAKKDLPVATDLYGDPLPKGALARLGTSRWRHGGVTSFVAFLPDGKHLVSASDDNVFHVWEFPSGKEIQRFGPGVNEPPPPPVRIFKPPVAMTLDGKILAYHHDRTELQLYEIATGKKLATLKYAGDHSRLAFSPDGRHLAVRDWLGQITIWDWKARQSQAIAVRHNLNIGQTPPLVYSPDGRLLAMTSYGQYASTIKLVDPSKSKGQQIRTLELDPPKQISAVLFAPDSKLLACSAEGGMVHLLDVATGKQVCTFKSAKSGPVAMAFARDGKSIITRSLFHQSMCEWDVNTGKELRTFGPVGQHDPPRSDLTMPWPALSPDGTILALAGIDHSLHFLDLVSGKEIHADGSNTLPVTAVGWAADGKSLWAQSYGKALRQWDPATGKALEPIALPVNSFLAALSGDTRYMATAPLWDKPGQIVDVATGKQVGQVLPSGSDQVLGPNHMVFSADGAFLAVYWEQMGKLEVYAAAQNKVLFTLGITAAQRGMARGGLAAWPTMLFSPEGKLLAAYSEPGVLTLWDTATGRKRASLPAPDDMPLAALAFAPDRRSLALEKSDGSVVLWELATCKERRIFTAKKAFLALPVTEFSFITAYQHAPSANVAFSPKGDVLVYGAPDGVIHVWQVQTGQELVSFHGHSGVINAFAFSADGKTLASASADTTVLTWDLTAALAKPLPQRVFNDAELKMRWDMLASDDAQTAFTAVCELAAAPSDAMAMLNQHLKPASPPESKQAAKLIAELGDDSFKVRQQAMAGLVQQKAQVVPFLDKALAAKPSLELKLRLEQVRDQLTGMRVPAEDLRMYRAIEVLERISTPEARQILERLGDGAPRARETEEAKAALERLVARP